MKKLLFAGIAATSMLMISPANAASDSSIANAETGKSTSIGGIFDGRRGGGTHHAGSRPVNHGQAMGGKHRWGHRVNGRWFAGHQAPNGWGGYVRPFRGLNLHAYWVQPSYSIVNYTLYGLYTPQTGYGWSRYYDDAVLIDGRGYVQDHRSDIPWERYEGGYAQGDFDQPDIGPSIAPDGSVYRYDDDVSSGNRHQQQSQQVVFHQGTGQAGYDQTGSRHSQQSGRSYQSRPGFEQYERCLQNRGITGGAIGVVVGGVIGNRLGRRGDRLIGTLTGAGLGGIIGLSIEKAAKKCKKYLPRDDYFYNNSAPQGEMAPPSPPPVQQPYPQQHGGYYQNGWYYPAPTVTTITVMPAVTTTTTVTEEVYYETVAAPARKKAVRKWKPKPKPRCTCR